ncbi:MAG TPA: Hsp20/alpha crystallin family protein [Solirubrobacterales bacterium]|jgi:HSP20 family protein|nr:Hsp20/alpha crystallin family protein [Solirubrobacterales bacterium]
MPRRDLFTDFERMRREMDEFLGAFWERPMVGPRRARGFSPKVDLYYCDEGTPKAVVKADLAGVPLSEVNLEISGRELVISGERPVQESEGRVYQQVEVETGPFRRVIELSADVDAEEAKATYEDGILRVELPLVPQREEARRVPVRRLEE